MDWMQNKGLRYFLRLSCLVLAYAVTARFVLNYFAANHVVSIIWPPSGIALAALLLGGKKYWPGVFVGRYWEIFQWRR
ncbi:MAG: MASE1 domain-containing protein [Cellvibrionales bacterium]|nr:MASE1 domain-containing protein [Cellvibrionales bacterium]